MMGANLSDHFIEPLEAWGVRRVLGYPGGSIDGLMGAFHRATPRASNRTGDVSKLEFIREWRSEIELHVAKWRAVLESRAMPSAKPINPQRVFREISPNLPDDAVLTCDSGTSAFRYARDLKIRNGMLPPLSGGLATMGSALPHAIAARHACPRQPAIALLGDGAMQMIGSG
jgi:thiamine pyrophosphate-dependent acetolactate synthase large subunit-like protein